MKSVTKMMFMLSAFLLVISFAAAANIFAAGAEEEEGSYYLICKYNNFDKNSIAYPLSHNAENVEFREYYCLLSFTVSGQAEFPYYIYDADSGEKYFPNAAGLALLEHDGEYTINFSLDNSYYSEGGTDYFTAAIFVGEDLPLYEYYLMCAQNNYEESDDYKLALNSVVSAYEEYVIDVPCEIKGEKFSYFIYRKLVEGTGVEENYYPNSTGVVTLAVSTAYIVRFSPEHVYFSEEGVSYYTVAEPIATEYYLMCVENNYEVNGDYILKANDENTGFREYIYSIYFYGATDYTYYIYEPVSKTKYFPNVKGITELTESGDYLIKFSPFHSYHTEYATDFFTAIEITEYDGYYIMCNVNSYCYQGGNAEFDKRYKLALNSTNDVYTYVISFDVTTAMLARYTAIDFYISNGRDKYRAPNGNFVINEAGVYEIYFTEPVDGNTATVYTYVSKSYISAESVSELCILDGEDNYVYIKADNLTSDMTAEVLVKGKYKFIVIKQNGKTVEYGSAEISYYVGKTPSNYEVSYYKNKTEALLNSRINGQYIVFSISQDTGFIITEKDSGLSVISILIIVAAVCAILLIMGIIISTIFKKIKSGKNNAHSAG